MKTLHTPKGFEVPSNFTGKPAEALRAFKKAKEKEAKALEAEATRLLAEDGELGYFDPEATVFDPFKLESTVSSYGTTYNATKVKATTFQKVANLTDATQRTSSYADVVVEDLEAEVLALDALDKARVAKSKKEEVLKAAHAYAHSFNPFTNPADAADLLEWYESAEGKAVLAAQRANLVKLSKKAHAATTRSGEKPVELEAVLPSPVEEYDLSTPTVWLTPNFPVWTPLKADGKHFTFGV